MFGISNQCGKDHDEAIPWICILSEDRASVIKPDVFPNVVGTEQDMGSTSEVVKIVSFTLHR